MTYARNRVFIGGISSSTSKDEIEREFSKYGRLNSVWVAQNPPGFAFVEYEDGRDAQEAVKQLNGTALFDDNKVSSISSLGVSIPSLLKTNYFAYFFLSFNSTSSIILCLSS